MPRKSIYAREAGRLTEPARIPSEQEKARLIIRTYFAEITSRQVNSAAAVAENLGYKLEAFRLK
jgi:hypothetical protein